VQQATNDSLDEAGVTVQEELEPSITATERHDGGDGIDGSGGGD
jgi:hypothetical protein